MAFPENPAAKEFLDKTVSNMRLGAEIDGESKNAKLDREMQERYKHQWLAGGDAALYGKEGLTIQDKIDAGIIRV